MTEPARNPPLAGEVFSLNLERALRAAARWHDGQVRKGESIPYVLHVIGVAWILDRVGFDEDVLIAGLLHDVVEDTNATLDDVRAGFGDRVARIVDWCSEVKRDAQGAKRPWIDRKRDHLEALEAAPVEARGVVLADKLHNLRSIEADLRNGRPVWSLFNAGRADVLWYYRATIDRLGAGDTRLESLAADCQRIHDELASMGETPG